MTRDEVENKLKFAVIALSQHQPNLFDLTLESSLTEWNIAHHYANEVSELFREFDCDIELTKINLDLKRPDITIHKRGAQEQNILVIEVKRSLSDVPGEIEKIKTWWFGRTLAYKFGAVVSIDNFSNTSVDVFENENQQTVV